MLRGLVSLGLIVFVASKVSWADLHAVLARLDLRWALAGWALSFFVIVGLTVRWRILLAQQNLRVPGRTIFALTWGGQFFNSILPGSTGGDVMKIYQLCRLAPERKAAAVATIFVDRSAALLALVTLALCGFILEPIPLKILFGDGPGWSASFVVSLVIGLVAAGGAVGWVALRLLRRSTWFGRWQRMVAATKTHFTAALAPVFLLAVAVHFITFTVFYLFARSLEINITYQQVILMVPVVLFLILLPITINGHGLREVLLIGYFSHLGIGLNGASVGGVQEIAIALSLVLVSNDLLWSLPGGLWYFITFRRPAAP